MLVHFENYNIKGYFKKRTFDTKGDLTLVEYYRTYDGITYSNLVVKETRTYTRNITTGILEKRDMVIEFWNNTKLLLTKNTIKYYTALEGFKNNKKARQNLLNNASMYLLGQVGLTNAKAFWKTLAAGAVDDYKEIGDLNLVTLINASTETYITTAIKAGLDTILNVSYI